ncbi:microtubule-actin cross-linking factor 1 isoform X5 [Daktulosphaira vitifoliae]|uniref:microtubule-actin cross-linking factor 1 isoform X5 n=1 Tax=Daktulosphaira vitifoliae TaxID=58002 RepID=UPI0021AA47EA|nr:microtubule-actin cross-linking factor 1 isoform X5 [Daktulosphaira vitifoliae]
MSYYKDRLGFDPDEPVTNGDALKSKRGYEESLCKFKDERDAIQKKTFTKWVNKHLKKHWKFSKENAVENNCAFQTSPCSPQAGSSCLCANRHVGDLFIDLQDGLNLISLLEVLSGDQLPRERGKLRFHMLQNVQMALEYLRFKKIKLVNIRAEDIVDGNPKLTLGLIWTIILHFQISDIVVGEEPNVSARDALLKWARKSTSKYPGVRVSDFTSSWRDGMAFNAIIHRNRPDLVDWRTVKNKTVRERLESAFYTAEREYGVTRLLDPEDVDTHEIDEKSIITYISSLHEVFPDPPRLHPLYDSDSQQRISEYREIATSLNRWMREKLSHMSDRNFPNTLIDMKKLASESTRFRNEELPPRHRDKQHLVHLYKDLQKYFDAVGEVDIEPELQADSIDRTWNRLMMTYQDRDSAIQEEIKRLERLQRLAEKVHREAKRTDLKLDELETRIVEEGRRADRLHPLDAKHNADQLETELRLSEDTIQSLFVDVQALREGRYAQAPELQKRVEKLHQKWVNLRSLLHSKVLTPLASLSFPIVEERTVTKQTRTILETRLVDTNTHFRSLQECIDWCNNKLKQLQEAEYGSDLPSVKALLDQHKREHKLIDQFHSKVEQCINAKSNFHGDELALYSQHLNTLQRVYSDLVTFSNKRLSDLETLQDFLQSATNQLKWLNEKEEIELNRDWSDKDLNIPSIRQYYENLMSELEKREIQLSSVQDRGEALILQGHSASKTIESYITALQTQWTWLLQLTLCLETHLKHATYYHQFYTDVKDAENWLNKRDELLNTVYSQSEFSLDEGERLLKGMQELRDELNNFSEAIATLDERSRQVVPLKQRRLPVTRPITVNAICSYKQNGINVEKGSQWLLHDNSGRVKWRVSRGMNLTDDCNVPGVVFLIPPPDQEALDAIERLRRAYDRTIALWQRKQLRMRQNMIFATIKVVKSWDLAQFLAMGADQRNAIRKALNEDANKLLREGDPADPQLRRLKREMDEVNKLFDEFERLSKAEEDAKNLTRIFNEQAKTIQLSLDEYEHTLNTRLSAPIPRDIDTLEHLVIQHKDFETSLKAMGPEVEAMQATFKKMPNKTHALQAKHDKILNQWNQLWNLSQLYVERLKCAEITLTGIEEANNTISDFEIKLASFGEMPSELPALKLVHEDLIALQKSVLRHQPAIDQLVEDKNNTRRLTEKSRHHLPRPVHHDLDRLDSDVNRIVNRWNNVCSQLVDRLKSCEAAYDLLSKYKNAYQNEVQVVDDNFQKMQAKDLTASTRALYNKVQEHIKAIESVNVDGGRFIREAKIFDLRLQHYCAWLVEEVHPSLDASSYQKGQNMDPSAGEIAISHELDVLNHRFQALLNMLVDQLKNLASLNLDDHELQEFVNSIEVRPLRTFRTEFNIYDTVAEISTNGVNGEQILAHKTNGLQATMGNHNTSLPAADSSASSDTRSIWQRMNEGGFADDDIINTPGIVHPKSGVVLTVGEAIRQRVLDVRTGRIATQPDLKSGWLDIEQAVEKGLMHRALAEKLLGPCIMSAENGGPYMTLLEAIQKELLDAERGPMERIKVKNEESLESSEVRGEIFQMLNKKVTVNNKEITVLDAIYRGHLDELQLDEEELLLLSKLNGLKPKSSIKALLTKTLDALKLNDDARIDVPFEGWGLFEAIEQNLLDPISGVFIVPGTDRLVSFKECIDLGIINSESAVVVDPKKARTLNLKQALRKNILDMTGHYRGTTMKEAIEAYFVCDPLAIPVFVELVEPQNNKHKKEYTSSVKHSFVVQDSITEEEIDDIDQYNYSSLIKPVVSISQFDYGMAGITPQAMAEKYKLCDDTLTEYLNWIGEIEDRIANQDIAQEDLDQLRNQINVLKLIKEEIDSQLRPITTCLDQVRHIIATGSEFLSREEVNKVEKNGKLLKSRYDHANDRTDKLLRRLVSAKDELSKFKSELTTFTTWMDRAYRTLEEKERALANINRLSDTSSTESTKDFVSDVIAHQADLRFITMAAQKFNDESKEYLTCLNEFRTGLPSRLPHIEPISSHDSVVKNTVTRVTNNYKDLLSRANALSDKLSGLSSKQREYRDALATAKAWLRDVEPRAVKILNEPIGADSSALEDQLNRTRTLNNEFLGQARLIENVKQAADALVRSLEGQSGMKEIEAIQGPVKDLEDKYRSLCNGLADRLSQLDTALVQSHGVQDALDSLLQWLNDAENSLKNITRPVSLHPERLAEQIREYRLLQSDIDTHRASVDSVAHSTQELMINSSNPRLAKKIENKLKDVTNRFEKLLDRTAKRGELLNDINQTLSSFNSQAAMLEQWLSNALENFHDLPENKLDDLIAQRDSQRQTLDQTVRDGKTLINNKDVTDTPPVRDRVKNLETQWKNLNQLLEEKQRVSKAKAEQLQAYEKLRDQVLVWLNNTEKRVNQLESVAVDMNILKNQLEELKPIAKDHRDYSITIDKLNDLGATFYDTTSYSNSLRRRSSVSPTKRFSIDSLRRTSRDSNRTSFSSYSRIEDGLDDSPVQQELNEINNRYNLLGVRISDRQNELDTIRDEVKRMTDNMKILNQFLDRTQKLIPKESIPMSKEESDKAVRQVKSILEEIYEKQSLLDSTKSGVNDLLRKKPTSLGADKLHDELQSITTRWKSLNDTCKNRIQLLEDLKDFHDSHDNLSNWLGAKERMMNVLGPISSDSRIVQSQVQQLQVLREEFRTQQPQLTHLTTVGESILSRLPDPHSQDAQRLANKLDAIRQKWADLLSKLDERASNLGAAADSTREFDAGLARLTGALQNISDQLDDLTYDKDPEEKLRKIQNLERQLEGQRPLLADLEDAGNHLCDVLDDPACKADIQSKLAAVNRQYNNLQKKLDNKKAEIEGSLKDGRQFEADCALTLGWLSDNLGGLTERLLISADRDILQQQVAQYEPIYKEVLHKEHEIIMLLNKGRDMLSRAGQKGEIRNLQRDLDKIQQNWDKLRKDAVERHNRLQTCMEHCRKYYRALESFTPWLTQAENKLEQIKPSSFNKRDVDKQLRELAAFRNEVWKHSGEYENVKTLGETFLASCDVDKELVKQELASLKNRWDKLNSELTEKTQWLEDVSRKLADFSDNLRDSEHALQRCEDKLASHDSIGGAANDPKLLERIKALREEARKLRNPLTGLRQTAGDLASEAADMGIGDATKLQDDVDNLMDRLDDLEGKLDDRCDQLESASSALAKYADKVKTLGKNLNDLEAEFDALKPPGRDIKTVTGQLDEVDKFIKKLTRAGDDISQMLELGQRLDNSSSMRDQADILSRQLNKLDERASNRQTDLENVLEKLHGFKNKYDNVLHDIDHATDEFRNLKPIGSDVEAIKFQQKEFAGFRKNTIEPIVASVDEVNGLGQRLVQSAARGVNTSVLEKDLEKMNDKWNTLKEKLNERDRRLDYGLLQSGKFQEALDGFAKWLADTEELVSNQKPPSADYKVVKAQLQEQKFLKKMLADRQNSMSSIFDMGNEVAANADPRERREIEQQLKDLSQRFNTLDRGATKRMDDLQRAMVVAKEFIEKLTPLLEWLDKSEKKIKDMELVPTDEEKIQQRIKEHNKLHNEILGKNPEFTDLTEVASTLMALVGEDEASGVADRIQETADRYATLVNTSEKLGQLLQHSRSGLRHLVLTYQDLQAWMEGMENRLNRYKVLPVHTDQLAQQMEDIADLCEEISNKQSDVDGTVDSGMELMKHITSDEAIQLKNKLDVLQRRYNDLVTTGTDLLKNAESMLPLVQQFHNAHKRLGDWMLSAESQLQMAEPKEEDIHNLELDIQEFRPVLENINQIGPQLCKMSPGEGASTIEGLVTRDNRRFDAICEQIQRKAERIQLSKQRSLEVIGDMDDLLDWFREVENQLRDAEPPSSEVDVIRVQLKEHKALNDDISSQKGRGRDVLSMAKKVLREVAQNNDASLMREKMEDLREVMDTVSALSAERLSILEQALPLALHFQESHYDLSRWLDDMERQVQVLAMPALRPELIAQQQDKNEQFIQSIAEHKPLVDKLNKTGEALIKLCNDEEGIKIQDILDSDNARYAALRAELRQRQQALEKALQETSQFSDKLEGMLRALQNTAEQVSGAEPISAHPPKIRDQQEENDAIVEDLNKRANAFQAVKKAANDVINKAPNASDPAVKDIKRKLDRLNSLWNEVQDATNDRGRSLEEALKLAEKFWDELQNVMATLKNIQDSLLSQEAPAVEPAMLKKQKAVLKEIKAEIDQTKPEVDQCRASGQKLMKVCGEPDKPEVKKHIEDLDNAWETVTALFAKCEENLISAMDKAMEFHETLQDLLKFLDGAERRFANLGPLGTDIQAVKKQINELKNFKSDIDPQMVKVEALNRQAQELTERTSAEQAAALKKPLSEVNRRWENLLKGIVERQRQLENSLLHLGQFHHALAELLAWIDATDKTLDRDLKPVPGDSQLLEVELAKLKVLVNDIHAHQSSVDTLNDAGRQLIESSKGSAEANNTQDKLNLLNKNWRDLLQKAADRQLELEDALTEAQRFGAEIQDLLSWLGEIDGVIATSKPVGGLPETASEQLERFMEVYNELESNRPKVETVLAQGQEYLKKSPGSSNLAHNLKILKQRWDSVTARANDKKIKLEIALKEATEFHNALQAFVDWLTDAEKTLSNLKPVSRILPTILSQIEDHKAFQKDVSSHREVMLHLDKKGTHLKYFSQKQDVILIKNLLISVQHRFERVVSKSAERTRALDHGYKEAREFHEAWSGLMEWLNNTEKNLDDLAQDSTVGNDPERIKQRLAKHRDVQRALSAKQGTYDSTMRMGKSLKEKAPKNDEHALNKMINELKEKWNLVCTKSVDRQRKLEEALLYCGQFKDAMEALLDWLRKAEKRLTDDGPVHGDLDTVMALVEQHKAFEETLSKRHDQMRTVKQTGKDLMSKASANDRAAIQSQLDDLESLWNRTSKLCNKRTERLEDALRQAEQLHKSVHMLLEWLSDAEMKLRFIGPLPDNEQETRSQLNDHRKFMDEMSDKKHEKDSTVSLAQNILEKAHPDAINVIKHWITIIQSRWEEVWSWAQQREQKLLEHLQSLQDLDSLLEELFSWLTKLENRLLDLESEPLPESIEVTEKLIEEHREFMENTAKRQSEVDAVCKAKQPAAPAGRKPSILKKTSTVSRTSTAVKDKSTDQLPHIGPRFPAKGSKVEEPLLRNSRCRQLWDKWHNVWLMAWERQRRLQEHLNYLKELDKVRNFSWDQWRKRFLNFMNHKKSRLTDLFRKMDKNNDGLIPRDDFIDGIIKTKFDTSKLEMNAVADMFDHDGLGLIDWKEFIAALRPDWEEKKPDTEAEKIHDEVKRLVMLCTCRQKFRVFQVGEGRYRFGDSQKLRLVRILRSTVMVRVGGGWVALDEFLVKNDPCRVEMMPMPNPFMPDQHEPWCPYSMIQLNSKGRTNIELREQFILADGVSQSMSAFKSKHNTQQQQRSGSTAGPITKVRERSARSEPMGKMGVNRTVKTPDSLSDNESSPYSRTPIRKGSTPVTRKSSIGGYTSSLPASRPGSRPQSRQGSKPPSRHGSNLSLDSTDSNTPSRIPRLTPGKTSTARKTNGQVSSRGRSPGPLANQSTTSSNRSLSMHRSSSIPTLSNSSSSRSHGSKIPIFLGQPSSRDSTLPMVSPMSSAPSSGLQSPLATPSSANLSRKPSNASDTKRRNSKPGSDSSREPFRL